MTLHPALEIDGDGAHPQAWRRAEHPPAQLLTPRRVARVAAIAGLTPVTLDDDVQPPDGPSGRIGAAERTAFDAAPAVAPVASTTYAKPSCVLAALRRVRAGSASATP